VVSESGVVNVSNQGRRTQRHPVVAVCALAWILSCGAASAAVFQLTVQPIQVCQDDGAGCANAARQLYEPETDKIWAQAGIDVEFLPWVSYYETDFLAVTSGAELENLMFGSGHGESGTAGVISMWFVNTLPGAGEFGAASVGGMHSAIADPTFTFGRLDTIAHELGHNLGLSHPSAAPIENLMTSGHVRGIPSGIADIYPDGAGRDQLTAQQIVQVLNTGLANGMLSDVSFSQDAVAQPEPSTLLLLASGLAYGIRTVRRRRQASPAMATSTTSD
jgi:hypothetical protein